MSPLNDTHDVNHGTGPAHARALSRRFFPSWSRRARARWVLAKLRARAPKVPISTRWSPDLRAYWLNRTSRVIAG